MSRPVPRSMRSRLQWLSLLPILIAWAGVYLSWWFLWGHFLRLWFWSAHAVHGRRVLFVSSDSPHWREHVEERILPRIRGRSVVLNWSERRRWDHESPWEARFFRRFAGDRDFNPLALVFLRWGRIRAVRFRRAFIERKRGKEAALPKVEAELFALLEDAGRRGPRDGRE